MSTIQTGSTVTLHNGRKATASARTCNTYGYIVWLTRDEAKKIGLRGYSTRRYSYSVDMGGNVERWVNGFGGWVASVVAPVAE